MITPASLKNYSQKELSKLAKAGGVSGWSSMSKDQLVKALTVKSLTKVQKSKPVAKPISKSLAKKSATPHSGINGAKVKASKPILTKAASSKTAATKTATKAPTKPAIVIASKSAPAKPEPIKRVTTPTKTAPTKSTVSATVARKPVTPPAPVAASASGTALPKAKAEVRTAKPAPPPPKPLPPSNPIVQRKIHDAHVVREQTKDLSRLSTIMRQSSKLAAPERDRVVLMVRDSYWLHACWELTRQTFERAKAAMAEHWHTAQPILRLYDVDIGTTTNTSERIARDIPIHGGVSNWYIDVANPPRGFRVDIGYLAATGKFFPLAKSNSISTPAPGAIDTIDNNWFAVAENYERVYAMSGGYSEEGGSSELQELFEERLRRPMGAPVVSRFGAGAERSNGKDAGFRFDVDAEMILFGSTKPDAHVTLSGEPVKLREDGTFTVRLSMPDKRQVLPVVASSADGIETRTVVVAVERNTKVMEPMVKDAND